MKSTLKCLFLAVALGFAAAHGSAQQLSPVKAPPSFVLENGDLNGDGNRDVTDLTYILQYLFLGTDKPVPICSEVNKLFNLVNFSSFEGVEAHDYNNNGLIDKVRNGDHDADGRVDITDYVILARWMFLGDPPPVALECQAEPLITPSTP